MTPPSPIPTAERMPCGANRCGCRNFIAESVAGEMRDWCQRSGCSHAIELHAPPPPPKAEQEAKRCEHANWQAGAVTAKTMCCMDCGAVFRLCAPSPSPQPEKEEPTTQEETTMRHAGESPAPLEAGRSDARSDQDTSPTRLQPKATECSTAGENPAPASQAEGGAGGLPQDSGDDDADGVNPDLAPPSSPATALKRGDAAPSSVWLVIGSLGSIAGVWREPRAAHDGRGNDDSVVRYVPADEAERECGHCANHPGMCCGQCAAALARLEMERDEQIAGNIAGSVAMAELRADNARLLAERDEARVEAKAAETTYRNTIASMVQREAFDQERRRAEKAEAEAERARRERDDLEASLKGERPLHRTCHETATALRARVEALEEGVRKALPIVVSANMGLGQVVQELRALLAQGDTNE